MNGIQRFFLSLRGDKSASDEAISLSDRNKRLEKNYF